MVQMESWSLPALGGFEWRVNLSQDDGKPSDYGPTGPEGSEDRALDDADEDAFRRGEWTFVQVHLALVYCNEDGSEIELGEEYLGNTHWGTGANWSVGQQEINLDPVMDMKMEIWRRVRPMFNDMAGGGVGAFDGEFEAHLVQRPSGYTPTGPSYLMGGMRVVVSDEEMALENNLSVNETWYKTRLGIVEEATLASNGKWAVHLRVDGKDYFFMAPSSHKFKVYEED